MELDIRNEKINFKVREHSVGKTPVIFAVGRREAEQNTVSIRRLGSKDQETLELEAAIHNVVTEGTPPDLRRKL